MTLAIQTHALTKRYGSHTALHDLDLKVERGSVFGLIGPNGAGKTTTLRMLLDIIRPTSGDIEVLGERPRSAGAPVTSATSHLESSASNQERRTAPWVSLGGRGSELCRRANRARRIGQRPPARSSSASTASTHALALLLTWDPDHHDSSASTRHSVTRDRTQRRQGRLP